MVACICNDVKEWQVRRMARMADNPKHLAYLCSISNKCGKCAILVKEIFDEEKEKRET